MFKGAYVIERMDDLSLATETELIRRFHADLRAVASRVGDSRVRTEIYELGDYLSQALLLRPAAQRRPVSKLTARETDVLARVAVGDSNQTIACALGLTVATVKGYLRDVFVKLDASSRYEAVIIARQGGLIP